MNVNWCTSCKCVLANEEVVGGVCERCGGEVIHKVKSQWMLKITEYAQRLIDDLDEVNYLDRIKATQVNWIGRSTGAEVDFYDPYIPRYRNEGPWYEGIPALTAEAVKQYDLVCITTAHTKVDYAMVASCGVPVFDCKNVCKNVQNRENIEVL